MPCAEPVFAQTSGVDVVFHGAGNAAGVFQVLPQRRAFVAGKVARFHENRAPFRVDDAGRVHTDAGDIIAGLVVPDLRRYQVQQARNAGGGKPPQLEMVKEFDSTTMNLYNLMIIGEKVHVVSSDDDFVSYYPEEFHFPLNEHESVTLIEDDKVYLDVWVEEGWDDENNCATEDYKYYTKLIIKDKNGNLLSEEVGSLEQQPDGTWWLS